MRRLGVSIYPEKSEAEKDKQYLQLAKKNGFSRIFTCLLSAKKPKEEIVQEFKSIISYAKKLDMEVILDISPQVFDHLEINYEDLGFFAELGADGIRLDVGFDGKKEAKLTLNKYNLKVELNMSNNVDYLNNILSHKPKKENMMGCHNFYPQKFTGLPYEFFISCSERFKKYGLKTAAFVSSQNGNIGPWDINDGLCTLEEHRELPIHVQAKHLWATGVIDDVIIGNAYASAEEMERLGRLNRYLLELEIEFQNGLFPLEKQIVLEEEHIRRGDISEYMIRSVEVRKKYMNRSINPRLRQSQECGDVAIGNNLFGKYKGELQVILKEMPADERKNVVANIVDAEHFLIDFIKPWSSFKLVEQEK